MALLDEKRLFKKNGFPMIMPVVTKHKGCWDTAKETIWDLVTTYVDKSMAYLINELEFMYSKDDIITAFIRVIQRDFFGKGFKRENMVQEYYQSKYTITHSTPAQEIQGIDLIATSDTEKIAISVKGKVLPEYQHVRLISNLLKTMNEYTKIVIIYVDEINKKGKCEVIYDRKEFQKTCD